MKITYSNYPEQIKKVDWTNIPETLTRAKDEMNEFHELYNDDDTIKETFDLFLVQLNKILVKADVKKSKPQKKEVQASSRTTKKQSSSTKPKLVNGAILVAAKINDTEITLVQKSATKVQFIVDGKGRTIGSYDEMIKKYEDHKKLLESQENKQVVKKQSSATKAKSIKTASNLVILQVRNNEGNYIGVLSHEHDNTKEKMRSMNAYLRMKAAEDFGSEFSNINSATGVTDKNGKPVYVISPNGRSIVKANTKDADYILGNWSSSSIIKKESKPKTKNQKPKTKTKQKESPCDDAIENYLENKKEARAKASAKNKRARIKEALDKENVNFYNAEFRLLRRFKNLVTKKGVVSFRSVQLLYMAFQKHAVARKVRKTSELANLYEICNKKLNKIYNAAAPKKQSANITFADTDVLEQLKKLVDNKKVDYAITLLNKVINVQGTAPEDAKVQRIISSIENGFKNGRVDERSRLYEDLKKAKSNLQKYIDDKVEKIPTVNYGLSGVKKKVATVATTKTTPKTITLPNPNTNVLNVANVVANLVDFQQQKPVNVETTNKTPVNTSNNIATTKQQEDGKNVENATKTTPAPATTPQKTVATKKLKNIDVLSTNDIMNMHFDTLNFTGKWYDFMQSPAKNMRLAFKGKPKNGKTSGCMALANVLTNYGNVLYNFADQGINKSTQDLWALSGLDKKENAFISATRDLKDLDKLCASGNFDFVFIDMINTYIHRSGIKYFEFEDQFLKKYPNISFILVFEATKSGDFKGDQGWTHLVDAIVNVENYVLHNNGRYGVGEYVVWEEGLKKQNPKKYKEFFPEEENEVESVINL